MPERSRIEMNEWPGSILAPIFRGIPHKTNTYGVAVLMTVSQLNDIINVRMIEAITTSFECTIHLLHVSDRSPAIDGLLLVSSSILF